MKRREPLPPRGDAEGNANKIKTFLENTLTNDNSYRIERMRIWEAARNFKRGNQWLEEDFTDDPTRTPFFKQIEVDENNWKPMPVHNEFVGPIQNEVSRLEGNGSRPHIRATDDKPVTTRAAKLSRDVLNHTLDELHWRETEHEGCDQMVTFGTWILKSYIDIDHSKTIRMPVVTAMRCPDCDFKLSSALVPRKRASSALQVYPDRVRDLSVHDENNPLVPPVAKAAATHCFTCQPKAPEPVLGLDGAPARDEFGLPQMTPEAPVPRLEQFIPSNDEAKGGRDHYGRPMGEDTARVDVGLENVSVYDYHPENQGVEIGWKNVAEHGELRIRSLDWIANHFPSKAHLVEASDVDELLRWHPIVGGSRHAFGSGDGTDPSLFQNHCLVMEWHKEPWCEIREDEAGEKIARLNRGRSIIMAGNVVLLDGDYLIDCLDAETGEPTGETIARVRYEVIPWEILEKEVFGMSASELMFSQQESINTLIAQVQDARHRFGSPKILAKQGMDLLYAGFQDTGYNSDVYYYRAENESDAPIPFGNTQMDGQWAAEYQIYVDGIQRSVGTMDVEIGDAPVGVTAASAMMYMGEKAGERRKHRIDRIREAKKRTYKHMLQIIQEKYREEREYQAQTLSERRTIKKFTGHELLNQFQVEFDDEPAFNTRMFRRESIKEAVTMGTITIDTASTKRKINMEMGAPTNINEDQNKQVERATDEWMGYLEDGIQPAVSVRGDDHVIHSQQHMLDLMGEDAQAIRDEVDWNQVELALWGWDEDFDKLMAGEAMLKAAPPAATPNKAMPDLEGNVDPAAQQAENDAWAQKLELQAKLAALPRALELRILKFQMGILDESGIFTSADPLAALAGAAPAQDLRRRKRVELLLRFTAHAEAHYRTAEKLAFKAAAGAALPAAPGGVETAGGMIPGGPGAALPGAGTGMGAATASGAGGAGAMA